MRATFGRSTELGRLSDALADPDVDGVVIAGRPGVGTSHLAAALADMRAAQGGAVHTVRSRSAVPAGLAALDDASLVVVDPVSALDDEAVGGVLDAVVRAGAALAATHRSGERLAEPLGAAVRAGRIVRVECAPVDDGALAELAEHVADRPLTPDSTAELVELAAGSPLHLRELVTAIVEADELVDRGDAWAVETMPMAAPRLVELVERRLAALAGEERAAVETVAAVEPVSPGALADVVAGEVLERMRVAGVVDVGLDERRGVVRLASPLVAAVIRASGSPLWRREVRDRVGSTVRALGARRLVDRVRLAEWSLDGGEPVDVDTLVEASKHAFASGDAALALRLGRAAFERSPSFDTGRVLEAPIYESGDRDQLDAFLERWQPLAGTDAERLVVRNCAASARYWRLRDAGAVRALLDFASGLTDESQVAEARAAAASYLVTMGEVDEAVRIGEPLLHASPGRAQIHATLAVGHGWRAMGRVEDAVDVVDTVMAAYRAAGETPYIVSKTILGNIGVHARAEAGDFDGAERAAAEAFGIRGDASASTALGLAHLALGWAGVQQGLGDRVESNLSDARYWLERARHPGLVRWAVIARALGRLQRGDVDGGVALRRDVDRIGDHPARLFESTLARVDARIAHEHGHPEDAARLLVAAAAEDVGVGNLVGAIGCWHDLARLGRARQAVGEIEQADVGGVQGTLLALYLDHARAVAGRDLDELESIVDRASEVGTTLLGSETAMLAAGVAGERRDARRSARLLRTATELAESIGLDETSRTAETVIAGLTDREWEVARLAARGVSSREIGERLFISARTVDNHLGRIYAKLGVSDRRALAERLTG